MSKINNFKKINLSKEEWRKLLPPEVFRILREKATEPPFTGKYVDFKKSGIYICAGCKTALFSSETKFNSGTGWPSFFSAFEENIKTQTDKSLGMQRTEVHCRICGGHLGHLFNDGSQPTGLRYCINSLALEFEENKKD
ncbi:MAG: peptide-methionine (R)-S-oxide reductase MsrB [Candidatus Thermoplasmatota archaeon]|nr:peptide-methionine (R)-S-oxide reductase MsrB [Candidatus Thermoplasmatota archaeon]